MKTILVQIRPKKEEGVAKAIPTPRVEASTHPRYVEGTWMDWVRIRGAINDGYRVTIKPEGWREDEKSESKGRTAEVVSRKREAA